MPIVLTDVNPASHMPAISEASGFEPTTQFTVQSKSNFYNLFNVIQLRLSFDRHLWGMAVK